MRKRTGLESVPKNWRLIRQKLLPMLLALVVVVTSVDLTVYANANVATEVDSSNEIETEVDSLELEQESLVEESEEEIVSSEVESEDESDVEEVAVEEASENNDVVELNATELAKGNCGKNITWVMYEDGTLELSGSGEMYDYEYYAPWYSEYNNKIEKVVIGNGITSIGKYAFYSHYNLKSIYIGNTVKKIDEYAFYGASDLEKINDFEQGLLRVPDNVEEIKNYSFASTSFENMYLGGNLKKIETCSFFKCEFDTITIAKNVGEIIQWRNGNSYEGAPFTYNTLYIGKDVTGDWWESKNVHREISTGEISAIRAGGIFEDYLKKSIVVDENNKDMLVRDGVLYLKKKDGYVLYFVAPENNFTAFPNDLEIVEISGSFNKNKGEKITGKLVIPESVKVISGYFDNCDNITEVVLPSNLTQLGHGAFSNCDNLRKVNIPKSLENNIRENEANYRCFQGTKLEEIVFEEGIEIIPAGLFHSCLLEEITIPDTVKVLEDNVFRYCSNLTTINVPEGVREIGWYCFGNSGIKTATLPSTVKWMNDIFSGCDLEKLTIKSRKEFSYFGDINTSALYGYKNSYAHELALKDNIPFYDIETGESIASTDYIISYRLNGGTNHPDNSVGYNKGQTVTFLEPTKEGNEFGGWFTSENEKITEVSGKSITVYAKWIDEDAFKVSEIEPQTYTGKAIKPTISVYDGKVLLKEKVDYTLSYKNNTKVASENAEKSAPCITVTGKGNYSGKETIYFTIQAKNISDLDVAVEDILVAYNSKVQKPTPTVMYNGKKLKNNTDYTVEFPDVTDGAYKNAGTYSIILKGKGNYSGEKEIKLTIAEVELLNKATISKITNQQYNGQSITPEFTVKSGKKVLVEGTDYTVSYQDNIKVGTAKITISGIGKYGGKKSATFKIVGKKISSAKVAGIPKSIYYTGEEITVDNPEWGDKPTLTMVIDGETKALVEGADYAISYQKNINKGTATIVFTGINGYSGTLKKTYKILPYNVFDDISGKISVAIDENQPYAKGGNKPKPVVKFGSVTLTEGKDYTLSYKNNTKLNDGSNPTKMPTVVIKGKGNFSSNISENFTIEKQSLSNLSISVSDKVYSKSKGAFKSTPKITDLNNKNLSAGTDYEKSYIYTYKNDVTLDDGTVRKAGEVVGATDIVPAGTVLCVTVVGKGNYVDSSITGEYRVVKSSISKASIKVASQTYTGKEITPNKSQITVKIGKQVLTADDYDIVGYSNNIKKGTAKVTIKGKGNYGGTKTVSFKIKSKGFLWWWR